MHYLHDHHHNLKHHLHDSKANWVILLCLATQACVAGGYNDLIITVLGGMFLHSPTGPKNLQRVGSLPIVSEPCTARGRINQLCSESTQKLLDINELVPGSGLLRSNPTIFRPS